jgi:hypothetical protein
MASNHLLRAAAARGNLTKVEARLMSGENLEGRHQSTGRTPLVEAVIAGHLDVAALLLDRGADPEAACTAVGLTALGWAVSQEHVEIARLLVDHGVTIDGSPPDSFLDRTPLHVAAQTGNVAIIALLLKAGASLQRVDGRGDNALALACGSGHSAAVTLLVAAGAVDPHPQDPSALLPWPKLTWNPCALHRDDALPDGVEPAQVVISYIHALSCWHRQTWPAWEAAIASGAPFDLVAALAEADRLIALHTTERKQTYRRASLGMHCDLTPEFELYGESSPTSSRRELLLRHPHPEVFVHEYEWEIVCLRRKGQWRIDSARNRLRGTSTWERALL